MSMWTFFIVFRQLFTKTYGVVVEKFGLEPYEVGLEDDMIIVYI